jgi:PKHD-type hydroxylase
MILCLAGVLGADEVAGMASRLAELDFVDGAATAGWQARPVKHNRQLPPGPATTALQAAVAAALDRHQLFQLACRPQRIRPALFSRYEPGMDYGSHVDDAVLPGPAPLRADISFTLFLAAPESYAGGELMIETSAGEQAFKLPAGALVLYPSTTLHRVAPVTSGVRLAAVGWLQSRLRDAAARELLFDLDTARRALFERHGRSRELDLLAKASANLMRRWVEL